MGKKKSIIVIICIMILLVIGLFFIVKTINKKKMSNTSTTTTAKVTRYEMIVTINPQVRLVFEIDSSCKDDKEKCIETSSKVIDYELINDDSKTIYKDVDFKGKSVYDSVVIICDKAKEKNIDTRNVYLTSTYKVSNDSIKDYIKTNTSSNIDVNLSVEYKEPKTNGEDLITTSTTTTTSTVVVTGTNTTTSSSTTSTTTKTTKSTTTADPHKGYVNLNDNIQVYENEPCGSYIKISDACTNMTIADLKAKYPSSVDGINDLISMTGAAETDKVNKLYEKYPLSYKEYIPECGSAPTGDVCNNKRYNGAYTSCNQYGLQIHYLSTKDSKYKSLFEYSKLISNLNSQKIYYEARCGGGSTEPVTLTQELCTKYNLKCDRW